MLSKNIIRQNPWWRRPRDFEEIDYDLRKYNENMVFFSRKFPPMEKGRIYFIKGPRRSGKTVWLKLYVKRLIEEGVEPSNILYLSCDRVPITSYAQLMNIIRFYLDVYRGETNYILMDEVTRVPKWSYAIKGLKDSGVLENCVTVVTGSIPIIIAREKELMPGRGVEKGDYYLLPASFRRFITSRLEDSGNKSLVDRLSKFSFSLNESFSSIAEKAAEVLPYIDVLDKYFLEYVRTGGFPEAVNSYVKIGDVGDEVIEIILNYIFGDMAKLGKDPDIAKYVLLKVCEKLSSISTYNGIAREIGVAIDTIKDYVQYLNQMFIVSVLGRYDPRRKISIFRGGVKLYLYDPFLYTAIRVHAQGVTVDYVLRETMTYDLLPKIVEGIVVTHVIRHGMSVLRPPESFAGYLRRNGEVDLVYKREDGTTLNIEVKYSAKAPRPRKRMLIITREHYLYDRSNRSLQIPAPLFLALLKDNPREL